MVAPTKYEPEVLVHAVALLVHITLSSEWKPLSYYARFHDHRRRLHSYQHV